MGILRISVDESGPVTATSAKLHLSVKGQAAVFGDVAAKRAREVQELTEKLLRVGVKESDIEVSGVNFDSTTKLLGRNQKVTISLVVKVEPDRLPAVLGLLSDAPNLSLDELEWVFETFDASIELSAKAMKMATRKAEAIAAAAGQRITGIESINDSWSRIEPRPVMMAFAASDSMMRKAPEMDLGVEYQSTTEVSVHLSVDFQISA